MGFSKIMFRVGLGLLLLCAPFFVSKAVVSADDASSAQLVISQFKVTTNDGQFFTLYNPSTTNSIDLGTYELEYFNNADLTKATSSKIIPLTGSLAPQSYYMLSDGTAAICYQLMVNTASLGFSTTSGFAEVLRLPQQTNTGNLIVPTVTDYVGWSKKTSGGNDTLTVTPAGTLATVQSGTSVQWLRQLPVPNVGGGSWSAVRPDPKNACSLQLIQAGSGGSQTVPSPGNQLAVGQEPPATIINLATASGTTAAPHLPEGDIGLAAPRITELLPNPTGTGNDDTDEFIELYNPNNTAFDLSGFTLQTGTTTKHSYVFPDETVLEPQSFTAFYSGDTGLSLSNTSGQADLLDPFGNMLAQTDAYGTAKDGQTWALANGKWYWTTNATPNAANVIVQPVAAKKTSSKASKSSSVTTAASTTGKSGSSSVGGASNAASTTTAPIHPLVLAAVGVLAVGYGVYEYRQDIANKFHEFRQNRRARRAHRV
jgi:hypothetical protein